MNDQEFRKKYPAPHGGSFVYDQKGKLLSVDGKSMEEIKKEEEARKKEAAKPAPKAEPASVKEGGSK